jgi:hypothetical protein
VEEVGGRPGFGHATWRRTASRGLVGSGTGRGAGPAGAGSGRPVHARAGEWGGVCWLRMSAWAGRGGGRSWAGPERTVPILI